MQKIIKKSNRGGSPGEAQPEGTWRLFRQFWRNASERSLLDRGAYGSASAPGDELRTMHRLSRSSQAFMTRKCGESFVTEVAVLLDLYLWCLGQDIRREGNLLLQAGVRKIPCPRPHPCGSRYEWVSGENQLVLWGFGVCFGNSQSERVVLRRPGFAPLFLVDARRTDFGWSSEELPAQRFPVEQEWETLKRLTSHLFEALARLEQAILLNAPSGYREACISTWKKGKSTTPREPGADWLRKAMILRSME